MDKKLYSVGQVLGTKGLTLDNLMDNVRPRQYADVTIDAQHDFRNLFLVEEPQNKVFLGLSGAVNAYMAKITGDLPDMSGAGMRIALAFTAISREIEAMRIKDHPLLRVGYMAEILRLLQEAGMLDTIQELSEVDPQVLVAFESEAEPLMEVIAGIESSTFENQIGGEITAAMDHAMQCVGGGLDHVLTTTAKTDSAIEKLPGLDANTAMSPDVARATIIGAGIPEAVKDTLLQVINDAAAKGKIIHFIGELPKRDKSNDN